MDHRRYGSAVGHGRFRRHAEIMATHEVVAGLAGRDHHVILCDMGFDHVAFPGLGLDDLALAVAGLNMI